MKDSEIIVVDGSPEKDTLNAIKDKEVVQLSSEKGRAKQMNLGAEKATNTIFLFLHADTYLPKNAFQLITNELKTYSVGAFSLGIQSSNIIINIIEIIANIRTKLTKVPYGDQAHFVKKEVFTQLEGFKNIPILEDVDFMTRVKKARYPIKILNQKVKTSPRRWKKEGPIKRTLKNWRILIKYHLGVSPEKLKELYQ